MRAIIFLLLIVLFFTVVIFVLKRINKAIQTLRQQESTNVVENEVTVQCEQCQAYIAKSEATAKKLAVKTVYYCDQHSDQ